MQPYFFPYIGYFQLISASDNFVFYDDVNFIKRGWINRNRILYKNSEKLITVPLIKASQNKKINETYLFQFELWRQNFDQLIYQSYKSAPNFDNTYALIKESLSGKFETINDLNKSTTKCILDYLEIKTKTYSSSYFGGSHLKGQDRIIHLCNSLDSTTYLNPINGKLLYDEKYFESENLKLKFHEPRIEEYEQGTNSFFSRLSIIDVLMFNSVERTRYLLNVDQ